MKSTPKSNVEAFPGSSALISLVPLRPLQAPRFPSFAELVEIDRAGSVKPTKREGLFSALLTDPKILLLDLLDDPDKYEEGVSALVQDLVSGQKKLESLSGHEMDLLDRSVLDFSAPKRNKPAPAHVKVPEHKAAPKDEQDIHDSPDIALPPEMANAYWWLK